MRLSRLAALAAVAMACATAVGAKHAEAGAARAASVPGARTVASLLQGIPQDGVRLGRSDAPVTLVEYVDVQCPYCSRFSQEVFPTVVRRYVRTGRVRIVFRGLAFVGPESLTGLQWVFAAGRQDRLWNVLELLYANQGNENSGWVTAARLTATARSVDGLRLDTLRRDSAGRGVTAQIRCVAAAARKAHVPGTPYFEVGRSLGSLEPMRLKSFRPADFSAQLDHLLE